MGRARIVRVMPDRPGPRPLSPQRVLALLAMTALGLRVLLDLAWIAQIRLPSLDLGKAAGGLLALALVLGTLAAWPALRRLPLRWPLAAWIAWLAVGLVRAPAPARGLDFFLRYASPLLLMAVVAASVRTERAQRTLLWTVLGAAAIPIGLDLLGLLTHTAPTEELHGYHRLLGPYQDLHSHALAMAVFTVLGAFLALHGATGRRRALAGALGAAALACLATTWVRTGLVLVALALGVLLLLQRRWSALILLGAGIALALLLSARLRARFDDVWNLLTLTAPDGGWTALGTHRGAIWARSLSAFLALPPERILFGDGLGGHLVFWKPRDPHNEYLSLLYQLGPAGPLLWLWLAGAGAREAWTRLRDRSPWRVDLARLALSLLTAAAVVNALSNTFLSRLTIAWVLWAVVGLVLAAPPAAPQRR